MANSVIGALRVNLGIDSAQFQSGLKKSSSAIDRFAKQAAIGFAAVTAAGTAMATALAVGIKKTIDEADTLGRKAAQSLGVGVEELSRLRHAAELSGVSFEAMSTGFKRLAGTMSDAMNGVKSSGVNTLKALNIELKNSDGSMKSTSEVITQLADRFSRMEDGAQKTAIAMNVFGKRAGPDMIPLLNAGADGLREMMEEADRLGIVIDTKTARAAEAFNDNLTRLGKAKDGVILKITSALLPALELLSEKFLRVAADGEMIEAMSGGLIRALSFIGNEVGQVAILASRLAVELSALMEALGRLNNYDFSGAWSAFQDGQERSAEMAANMKRDIETIFSGANVSQGGIQRRIDDAFGTAGTSAGEKFVANFDKATGGGKKIKEKLDPIFREAARVFDATRTPLEQYQIQIGRLNAMLAAGAINQDTYNRAVIQAQDAFKKAEEAGKKTDRVFEQIGQSISSSFASAFQGLIDGSKRASDVLKDLLSQLTSMVLNKAFMSLVGGLFGGFGIPGFASGTNSAPRGFAVVGEKGPELVHFGGGEKVIPNHQLGRAGGDMKITVGVSADNNGNLMPFVDSVSQRNAVGVVQAAVPGIVSGSVSAVQQTSRNKPGFFR